MKLITVADIMQLDIMKGCRLAAGENGLSKEVRYINVYDNPISTADHDIQTYPGEISLTFFYHGKDNPDYLYYTLELLIERKAAALIVFDEYFQEMPQDFMSRCDQAALPLIFVDRRVPYSLLISSIIEYRIYTEQRKNIEDKLSAIVSTRTSAEEKLQLTTELNPGFQNTVIALYAVNANCDEDSGHTPKVEVLNLCSAVSRNSRFFASEYNGGILVILSYSDRRLSEMASSAKDTIAMIRKYLPNAAIGVSDPCHLTKLHMAISQSCTALRVDKIAAGKTSAYRDLGIARLLLELSNSSALEKFYQDTITPIQKYDLENNSMLLETMLCFSSHSMDYRKTAKAMFLHENTIRYRINKIKDLISYGKSEMDFLETISILSKIYHIKQAS